MAITGRFKGSMEDFFPHGLFVTSEVTAVRDFEKSTKDTFVQARDKDTGMPLWEFAALDPDPLATKATRQISVKVAAEHQPVPPEAIAGTPFRPVALEGIEVRPYVKDGSRPSVAYSVRASGMRSPHQAGGGRSGKSSGSEAA
jgi:hypothetical protein